MRVLAGAVPNAAGTEAAESFHSVLQRTAQIHSVSFTRFLTFLNAACQDGIGCRAKTNDLGSNLLGTGQRSRALVATYEELSYKQGLANHTLLPLSGVISPRANGAILGHQRWCPTCIHPEKGMGYGLFAHALRGVSHCRIHGKRLQEFCTECGSFQSYTVNFYAAPVCVQCKASLCDNKQRTVKRSRYDEWVESQLYDMVAYLSNPERPRPSSHWLEDASDTLHQWGQNAAGRLKNRDLLHVGCLNKRPKHGFSLATLLWLAAHYSTSLVEVILRPNEVLLDAFSVLEPVKRSTQVRHTYRAESVSVSLEVVESLLAASDSAWLPSLDTLAALTGVGNIWTRDRTLVLSYNAQRARSSRGQLAIACDRKFAELMLPLLPELNVRHYALERILSRRLVPIPSEVHAKIIRATLIMSQSIGRKISMSPNEFGLPSSSDRIV